MYVVTGGAGFIGSNLLSMMEARGLGPLALMDRADNTHKLRNTVKRGLAYKIAPEDSFRFLDANADAVTAVIHLGAITSTVERDIELLDEVNVRLSLAMWTWCARHETPFIYASSAATYGDGSCGFDDDHAPQHARIELRQ